MGIVSKKAIVRHITKPVLPMNVKPVMKSEKKTAARTSVRMIEANETSPSRDVLILREW